MCVLLHGYISHALFDLHCDHGRLTDLEQVLAALHSAAGLATLWYGAGVPYAILSDNTIAIYAMVSFSQC